MAATNTDFVDSGKLDALDTRTELYGLDRPSTSAPPTSLLERIPGVRALNRWRDERALPNPGTMEGLFREVNSASLCRSLCALSPAHICALAIGRAPIRVADHAQ